MRALTNRPPLIRALVGVLIVVGVLAAPPVTQAAALRPTAASTTSTAQQAATAVSAFRSDMTATLNAYLARYGDRLTEAERTRVTTLITQADTDLKGVSDQANTTVRWAKRGNASRTAASAKAAVQQYDRAYARAEQAIAEIKPILAPRLGFFEALEAQGDLDNRMATYRGLGTQLRGVVTASKA